MAPEKNPPGDIPDTQAFVTYRSSSGGYSIKVPEGWARSENGSTVRFVDKLDGLSVTTRSASHPPTLAEVKNVEVPLLERTGRAVRIVDLRTIRRHVGSTIVVSYTANSAPDPVTNKQVREEESSYFFFHSGRLAILTLWAPLGADNVDQWNQMSNSFRWS